MIVEMKQANRYSPEQHAVLPSNWFYAPLGSICKMVAGGTPTSDNADYWVSDSFDSIGVPWISISDMSQVDRVFTTNKSVSSSGIEAANLSVGKPGTVLFAMYASVGEVAVTDIASVWNQAILGMTPTDSSKLNSRFLFYALKSLRQYLPTYYRSNTQNNLNAATVAQLRIPLPPLDEQQRIADYLDRETAEIDATVTDLDKYVELLEKRKRAVGSALLNEALEDESTLMVHLGSLGTFISGTGFPHDYQGIEDEEYPFYKVGSLAMTNGNEVIGDTRNTVSKETALDLGAKIIPRGSVLMAKIGEAMRLCRFAVNATDCCIDNNMMAIVPRFEHITTTYLRLAITLVAVDVLVNPGPVPSLNVQGLRMFSIPLPSLEIQERLTDEWKKETSEIDSLIEESTRLRDLLLKRRSVLITEVVTGRKQV